MQCLADKKHEVDNDQSTKLNTKDETEVKTVGLDVDLYGNVVLK